MLRNRPTSTLAPLLGLLLVLALATALPAHADQPVTSWFDHLVSQTLRVLPWVQPRIESSTPPDNTFPDMDPNGVAAGTDPGDLDSPGVEAFPNMDPNGLQEATGGATIPNMYSND